MSWALKRRQGLFAGGYPQPASLSTVNHVHNEFISVLNSGIALESPC